MEAKTPTTPPQPPQPERKLSATELFRKRLDERKNARLRAKEEEKNYLEYRKMQILFDFKPVSSALHRAKEDAFPKRKFSYKDMQFGARRIYFLSLRPNAKFADWTRKKQEEEHRNKELEIDNLTRNKNNEPKTKMFPGAGALLSTISQPTDFQEHILQMDKVSKDTCLGTEKDKIRKGDAEKGNQALAPIVYILPDGSRVVKEDKKLLKDGRVNRVMFWVDAAENEDKEGGANSEPTDEDNGIDTQQMTAFIEGKLQLHPPKMIRKKFNPYDRIDFYRGQDKLFFDRDRHILANTIFGMVLMYSENEPMSNDPISRRSSTEAPRLELSFADTVTEYTQYIGPKRDPKAKAEKKVVKMKDMKNIVNEPEKE